MVVRGVVVRLLHAQEFGVPLGTSFRVEDGEGDLKAAGDRWHNDLFQPSGRDAVATTPRATSDALFSGAVLGVSYGQGDGLRRTGHDHG